MVSRETFRMASAEPAVLALPAAACFARARRAMRMSRSVSTTKTNSSPFSCWSTALPLTAAIACHRSGSVTWISVKDCRYSLLAAARAAFSSVPTSTGSGLKRRMVRWRKAVSPGWRLMSVIYCASFRLAACQALAGGLAVIACCGWDDGGRDRRGRRASLPGSPSYVSRETMSRNGAAGLRRQTLMTPRQVSTTATAASEAMTPIAVHSPAPMRRPLPRLAAM